ncbi:substrate-binding domain-containing protein [Mycobacterium sp. 21AC1]|uniref:substrate-binding domain-containing protein n=1 Tax=[Mycobacterium] appelbergii TaxID=2939269 RepID=UPI002939035A|nr:substrate-binding domain-containing protein [Mycobacterium sp. 21AC1]MDV3128055.1 substrate-binding domain-containing protein [Mycobacterium sp. 21AC1]
MTRSLRRRVIQSAAVLMIAVLAVSGCSRIGENGRIAVVYLNAEGFYAGVKAGVQKTFDDTGDAPQLIEINAQSDPSQESAFIDTVSSVQVDALILSPTSAEASIPAIRLAHASGIPVICYNTCITEADARKYVDSWILGSPKEFGRIGGEQMGKYFRDQGIVDPKVAVVNCEQFEVCIQRRQGFEEALLALVPGAQVVANQQGLLVDEAVRAAERILTAHPDLNAFYGEAGSMTVGAVRAVQARGLAGQVVVFGGDMSTQIAQMLQEGSVLKGIADISGITVGEMAAESALHILNGERPETLIVDAPVDAHQGPGDGARWLQEHPDGIP